MQQTGQISRRVIHRQMIDWGQKSVSSTTRQIVGPVSRLWRGVLPPFDLSRPEIPAQLIPVWRRQCLTAE